MKHPGADKNRRTVVLLAAVALGMFAFGFALVPLYGLLCRVAGIPSIQAPLEISQVPATLETDRTRRIVVKFDTTVSAGLPWEFRPLVRRVSVHPGEAQQVMFLARNLAAETITGNAIPVLLPVQVAEHFTKTECFCFREQALAPGETREMVLRFMVSPRLPAEISELTLSYTFMNSDPASAEKYRGLVSHSPLQPDEKSVKPAAVTGTPPPADNANTRPEAAGGIPGV